MLPRRRHRHGIPGPGCSRSVNPAAASKPCHTFAVRARRGSLHPVVPALPRCDPSSTVMATRIPWRHPLLQAHGDEVHRGFPGQMRGRLDVWWSLAPAFIQPIGRESEPGPPDFQASWVDSVAKCSRFVTKKTPLTPRAHGTASPGKHAIARGDRRLARGPGLPVPRTRGPAVSVSNGWGPRGVEMNRGPERR